MPESLTVNLVDGTYELFRQFFGQRDRPRRSPSGHEVGAAWGVVASLVTMLADGATHLGVATDHVIESFRNGLWPGYKTGQGIAPELLSQFGLLEEAVAALGVALWPMVELEADDALGSAAAVAADDPAVERVVIWTPDKDLGQCVVGDRVVQYDRRARTILDDAAIRAKFGVRPASIPDWLALVGDSADGFPGLAGWGKKSASLVLDHYLHLENIPAKASDWDPALLRSVRSAPGLAARLAEDRELALLFRQIATLRIDRSLLAGTDDLRWSGPEDSFAAVCAFLGDPALADRAAAISAARSRR